MLQSSLSINFLHMFEASELTSEFGRRDLQHRHHLPGTWLGQVGCSLRRGLTDGPGNVKVAFRNRGFIRRNGSMLSRRPYACVCAVHAPLSTYLLFVETARDYLLDIIYRFLICLANLSFIALFYLLITYASFACSYFCFSYTKK